MSKCCNIDKSLHDCHFETWLGTLNPKVIQCDISAIRSTQHILFIKSWRGYPTYVKTKTVNTDGTITFENTNSTSWEIDEANALRIPSILKGPITRSRQVVAETTEQNQPDQVISVDLEFKSSLPGASWVGIPTMDIQVDVR